MTDWNVPPPPRPAGRPIRGRRVAAGIGIALAAHAATLLLLVGGLLFEDDDFAAGPGLVALGVGQLVVFIVCLTLGIVLTVRQDGGVGVGLLIGWAIGLLIAPIAGFGLCIWAFNAASST